MQHKIRLAKRLAAAPDALTLDRVAGFLQAGGVDEHHGDAANLRLLRDRVARRAGHGGDDGAVAAQQLIEQARLAGVGPADDGRADAAPDQLPLVGGGQQLVDESAGVLESRNQPVHRVRLYVFVGKINVRLDVREHVHQVVTQLVDALREFAGELLVGGAQREIGPRVDEIGDRLGLREINASVQKGALGELARQGQSRPPVEHGVEHGLGGADAAVAADLDDILSGKRRRGFHHRNHHLVEPPFILDDVPVMQCVRLGLGELGF